MRKDLIRKTAVQNFKGRDFLKSRNYNIRKKKNHNNLSVTHPKHTETYNAPDKEIKIIV